MTQEATTPGNHERYYKLSVYLEKGWRGRLDELARTKGFRTINSYLNALLVRDAGPLAPALPAPPAAAP